MTKEIQLTKDKVALVDDEDYEFLCQWKWRASYEDGRFYAVRMEGFPHRILVRMHRQIMNAPENVEVDHIDTNGLNNTRDNLRLCTRGENACNRNMQKNNKSGYKGVFKVQKTGKYRASIRYNRKTIYLGTFPNPEQAAQAYDEAAKKYFGVFARPNF